MQSTLTPPDKQVEHSSSSLQQVFVNAKLSLRTGKGKSFAEVPEFYVGSEPPSAPGLTKRSGASGEGGTAPGVHYRKEAGTVEERSSLVPDLMCLEREGKQGV